MRRPRRSRMPDPRIPLRALLDVLPGLGWLAALALAAWLWRAPTLDERLERVDAAVRAMEAVGGAEDPR